MEDKIAILERALERERASRKESERILEQKSAELYELTRQLQESNNKLHKLFIATRSELTGVFNNLADAYLMMDLSGNVLKMNDTAFNLLGYNCMDAEFNILQLVVKEDLQTVKSSFDRLLEDEILKDSMFRVYTKRGGIRILHMNCSLLFNESKKPVAIQGIFRDITQQREAEDELKASKNRLSMLVQHLDSGILLLDENDHAVLINKKMRELFDMPAVSETEENNTITGHVISNEALVENPESFVLRYNEIIRNRKEATGDELVLKSGKVLERNYIPVFDQGEFKGHLWSFNDITLKKKYRKSLETERQKYSSIIAHMNLGLVEVAKNNKILFVNQTFCKMIGYTEEELLGKDGSFMISRRMEIEKLLEHRSKRKKGLPSSYEAMITTKSGEERYWLFSGAPNYTIEGKITGSIGIVLDITDSKNLEFQKEALVQKLEKNNVELQEYAHIVSHDLKSPLRSIYALVSWLKEDNLGKLDETSLQNFALIETTLEKMEQLITDILNYSSAGANIMELEEVYVNEVLQEILQLLYIPPHIHITIENNMPVIHAEETKIKQLFQNLLSNAIKFMDKPDGFISIGVQEDHTKFTFYVKDNGMGIEEKYHHKVFEIFHSLNKSKDSSGIGLSIVKKIVKIYGGDVWLDSVPGEGATFYFTISKKVSV